MAIVAVYPGTFDPVTYGHIDLMRRGCALFDKLIVAVADNPQKNPMFNLAERVTFVQEATDDLGCIEVKPIEGLLVDFVKEANAQVILKGLRAVSDFEFELQLASTNRRLAPDIESIFMTPADEFSFISSTIVKEVSRVGGDVSTMAPPEVVAGLKERYGFR
jgi:pantetheine-phosphate adenylyltransferase